MLVSFCVKCFNQEAYIKEALEGAFAQTYRPLEIVISDDASTDRSVGIIERAIAEGTEAHPDIKVIFHRNEQNLGNLGNWLKLVSLSHGDFLVKADGDDVSLPERTSCLVAALSQAGDFCGVLYSNAVKIDAQGVACGDVTKEVFEKGLALGAVMAVRKACVDRFPDCGDRLAADDMVMSGRARILGYSDVRLPQRLVRYRVGVGVSNAVHSDFVQVMRRMMKMECASSACLLRDLEAVRTSLSPERYHALFQELANRLACHERICELWNGDSMFRRLCAFVRLHGDGHLTKDFLVHLVLVFPRFLSAPVLGRLHMMSKRMSRK